MTSLYVTEFGATVRKSGGSLVVTADVDPDGKGPLPERRETRIEVEPHRLELIALVGDVHITSDAVRLCLEQGIGIAWMSFGGRLQGRMVPESPRMGDLRLLQYEAHRDPAERLRRAARVVEAKLLAGAEVLEDFRSNHPSDALARAEVEIRAHAASALAAESPESLLGIEGAGARVYFDALRSAFIGEIPFEGRRKRPSPDPANALLSFGYTLLVGMAAGAIEARGLDPAIGFYHEVRSGRPSLALDLVEELRHPVVDRLVMRMCNLKIVGPGHFEPDAERKGGVRLTREGSRIFFRQWEEHLLKPLAERGSNNRIAPRDILVRQVDRLAADFRGGEPYAPFRFGD